MNILVKGSHSLNEIDIFKTAILGTQTMGINLKNTLDRGRHSYK